MLKIFFHNKFFHHILTSVIFSIFWKWNTIYPQSKFFIKKSRNLNFIFMVKILAPKLWNYSFWRQNERKNNFFSFWVFNDFMAQFFAKNTPKYFLFHQSRCFKEIGFFLLSFAWIGTLKKKFFFSVVAFNIYFFRVIVQCWLGHRVHQGVYHLVDPLYFKDHGDMMWFICQRI